LVIIPAALAIVPEMQFDFGPINPCMIPINGRSIIEYIIEKYDDGNTDFEVITRDDSILQNFLSHKKLGHLKTTIIDSSISLADTILRSKSDIKNYDSIILNFADTLVIDELPGESDFIAYQNSLDRLRWSRFSLDEENKINKIYDKNIESDEVKCFSGVFGIGSGTDFFEKLSANFKTDKGGAFYKAVTEYYNSRNSMNYWDIKSWYDFGHIDSYYKIKRQFFRERDFNTIKNTSNPHTIRKESTNKDKLINEINWYLKLPKDLKYLLPQIFGNNLSAESPSIDMEFCSFPPLNEIYIFSNFDQYVWMGIFDAVRSALIEMRQYTASEATDIKTELQEMYLSKTIERLKSIIDDKNFSGFSDNLTINSESCFGLREIITRLPEAIENIGLYETDTFSVIHGDLCCSNILYDRKIGQVKLIDPRGSFGTYDIYGDPLYDIAKLSHSFLGDYDFILSSLFEVTREENNFHLTIFNHTNSGMIKTLFRSFLGNMGYETRDYTKIRFIESLLFLSMVPLHHDNPKAQEAFLLRGIKLFSDILMQRRDEY